MVLPAWRLALVLHQAVARSVSGLDGCRLLLRLADVGVVQPDTCTVALLVTSDALLQTVHSLTARLVWRAHGYLSASDEV